MPAFDVPRAWPNVDKTSRQSRLRQKIGGVEDHVHMLSSLSKNIAFSELIRRIKGSSSKRLKEKGVQGFAWQNGYGAFPVSESDAEAVILYITNQAEHHRKFSFQEEVRELPSGIA